MGVDQKFTCKIFHFIFNYVQVGYYMCMIPFKPTVDEEGKLQFIENKFHKVDHEFALTNFNIFI